MKLSNSYIGLPEEFYQLVDPSPVKDPSLIIYNQDLAASLKIDLEKEEVLKYFQIFSQEVLLIFLIITMVNVEEKFVYEQKFHS